MTRIAAGPAKNKSKAEPRKTRLETPATTKVIRSRTQRAQSQGPSNTPTAHSPQSPFIRVAQNSAPTSSGSVRQVQNPSPDQTPNGSDTGNQTSAEDPDRAAKENQLADFASLSALTNYIDVDALLGYRQSLDTIRGSFTEFAGSSDTFNKERLTQVAQQGGEKAKTAAQFLLDHPIYLNQLDAHSGRNDQVTLDDIKGELELVEQQRVHLEDEPLPLVTPGLAAFASLARNLPAFDTRPESDRRTTGSASTTCSPPTTRRAHR